MMRLGKVAKRFLHLAVFAAFAFFIFLFPIPASSKSIGEGSSSDLEVVWVLFRDKGLQDANRRSIARGDAENWISARSRFRRIKRGRLSAPVGERDYPVHPAYVRSVLGSGAKKRMESRWLNGITVDANREQIEAIARLPFVLSVDPARKSNRRNAPKTGPSLISNKGISPVLHTAQATSATLNYGLCYDQLQMIGVPAAHAAGYDGSGVIIGILDSGFRKSHEALGDRFLLKERDFVFNDDSVQYDSTNPNDYSDAHGTAVWALAGGYKNGAYIGVAFNASFLLAKTEDTRTEKPVEEDYWVAGLEWLEANGADVVNSSLGYMEFDAGFPSHAYSELDGKTLKPTIAANIAASLGVVICNSMGNEGPATGTLSSPADARDILSSGAVNALREIASFSSRGPTADGRIKPEVCAFGQDAYVASINPLAPYTRGSGTSYSTPLVTGAVALILQAHPNWTPNQIRTALANTASQAKSPDSIFGWGIIDVMAAIAYQAKTNASHWPLYQ